MRLGLLLLCLGTLVVASFASLRLTAALDAAAMWW